MKKVSVVFITLIFLTTPFFHSCSNQGSEKQAGETKIEADLQISQEQFSASKMEIGNPVKTTFEDFVKVSGLIVPPVNGKAMVSSYISGIIKSLAFSPGDYVAKGQTLCTINSSEVIALQQEFAETSSKLNKLSSDYQRMKTLMDEKIGAQKDFIAVESEYQVMKAKYEGLSSQMALLGIRVQDILNGKITSNVDVIAPISGFLTVQNCIMGQFVEPQMVLFEIVDQNQLQLQLSVYTKDIHQLVKGQKIRFYNPANKSKSGTAELYSLGKSIDQETKTINCFARISGNKTFQLIEGEYVEAEIIISETEAFALPTEAIQKSADEYFVFVKVKEEKGVFFFSKMKVNVGKSNSQFTEIQSNASLKDILIRGTYNLTTTD